MNTHATLGDRVLEWCASWFDDRGDAPTLTYADFEEAFGTFMGWVIGLTLGGLAFWLMWVLFAMGGH